MATATHPLQRDGPIIVWLRDDLRTTDNPALSAAAEASRPVIVIFVLDEQTVGVRRLGGAARWWLHGSIDAVGSALATRGGRIWCFRGATIDTVERIVVESKAAAVYWNHGYDGAGRQIDAELKSTLQRLGCAAESFGANLIHEPWSVESGGGSPFRVFSAFWRAASVLDAPARPLPVPRTIQFADIAAIERMSVPLAALELEPSRPDWASGLRESWQRGERGAQACLRKFLDNGLRAYGTERDRPDRSSTSRLSPYLRFGNISARQVWYAVAASVASRPEPALEQYLDKLLLELGWREFSYYLLFHHPDIARRNLQQAFDRMKWREDALGLHAWQRGRTGYPLVDAGMRQLWATGWMHNRVRMVTASFLTRHLLIDWRQGEAWFWDTLVDADPASNPASWQWVTGSVTEESPLLRVFNPALQGEKFDPDGAYVKRWVPELAGLPRSVVHRPWQASPAQLSAAGLTLGETYPLPIVDHRAARRRALDAFKAIARP